MRLIACGIQEEDDLGDMMYEDCVNKLRKQAKQLGYNLIKIKPYIRKTRCPCGAKQVKTWYIPKGIRIECKKCERTAEGIDEEYAKMIWNMQIERKE